MNKTFVTVVAIAAVLLCSISFAESIKCVQCSSCQQTWDNSTDSSTNCTTGFDACMKTAILYPGGNFITKSCILKSACSDKKELLLFGSIGYHFSCCQTDDCNAAPMSKANSFVFFSLLFVSIKSIF